MSIGLDVGTSFLIKAAESAPGEINFKEFRDAFFKVTPATPIAAKMLEKGLKNIAYFKDTDGSYVIVGQDAIEKAVERNTSARRPLYRGVLSPREPDARKVLKFILGELVGKPATPGEKLVYSVPAEPIDQTEETFNTGYHEDCLKKDLGELGWDAIPLNEGAAICYSELDNEGYTGISVSCGAGQINTCIMSAGEAILKMSIARAGDWIDRMASLSTGQADSVIQAEKENTPFIVGQESSNQIISAVSAYYVRLIDYAVSCLSAAIRQSKALPKFHDPISFVIAGGTSRAGGFIDVFRTRLEKESLPFKIKEVRYAKDQLRAVARGCLLTSSL